MRPDRLRRPKLIAFGLGSCALLALFALMLRAAKLELDLDFHPPHGAIGNPADAALAGIRTVDLAPPGEPALTAFYRAPNNGRTVILLHGSAANRAQLLPEARILATHGFGILNLDWPGHGGSGGRVEWDEPERAALRRALTWVSEQPGGSKTAIGVLGFSMGAWIALQVAATDQRIQALALTGAFADVKEALLGSKGRHLGWLVEWPTLMAARSHNLRYSERLSIDLIPLIAPRPVFLVAGDADQDVPAATSKQLWEAAREPKSFWLVPGAGHGQYAEKEPAEYERRLSQFFLDSLPPQPGP